MVKPGYINKCIISHSYRFCDKNTSKTFILIFLIVHLQKDMWEYFSEGMK